MLLDLFKNLLIHAEGGDGAGAAPANAAPGAEAAGVTAPDAGEKKQEKSKPKKYGRAERLPYEYGLAPQPKQEAPAEQKEAAQNETAKRPWDEVKNDYKDEIAQIVQGRVKNLKDSEAELTTVKADLEKRETLLAQLAEAQYGIKPGEDGKLDYAALEQEMIKAKAQRYAEEHGVSDEFAEERMRQEAQIEEQKRQLNAYRMAEEARQKDAAAYALVQKNLQQAEAFRQKVPNFDLKTEIDNNELFRHLVVNCGVGVENAYYAAHHEELMAYGQQAAAQQATQALASRIQAGQSMPTEGGLGRAPAANPQRVVNPKQWTKEMRADVRRRVQRGEDIYL